MGQTLRQIASDLTLDLKARNIDDHITFRYLVNKFNDKLAYYLRLEGRSRELMRDISIWQPLKCIDLIEVATNSCGYKDCTILKRSVKKLPEAYVLNYGLMLKILTVDGLITLVPIKSNELSSRTKFEYGGGNLPYWVEDDYLYIPNTEIEVVKGLILPKNPIEVKVFNNPCECVYPLDGEITVTDYLIGLAKKEVYMELLQSKQIVQDEAGNDNTNLKN